MASIFGCLASLSRITGLLLFLPVLIEYFQANRKHLFKVSLITLILIPLGTVLFFLYHFVKFGDILLFFKAEQWFGRGNGFTAYNYTFHTLPAVTNFSLDVCFTLFAVIAGLILLLKVKFSYGVYALSTVAFVLSSGTPTGIARYILVVFPLYILGASIKNKIIAQVWILVSVLLFALYTLLFVNHYWAG